MAIRQSRVREVYEPMAVRIVESGQDKPAAGAGHHVEDCESCEGYEDYECYEDYEGYVRQQQRLRGQPEQRDPIIQVSGYASELGAIDAFRNA